MNDPDRSGPANGHGDDRASRLSAAILRISLSLDLATVLDDDRLHLVEQKLTGHAAEVGKRRLQAMHQGLHGLPGVELNPQQPRVAQHDD